MSRPLTNEELGQVRFEEDIDSYTILSKSLAAFDYPEDFKFVSNSPTGECRNGALWKLLQVRSGYRYHREFCIGGSGVHKTYVLIVHKSIPIPDGAKEWFLTQALRYGIESLDKNSRTRFYLFGYDSFKICPEDSQKVWQETDSYLREQREQATAEESRRFINLSEPQPNDTATYGPLRFLYYRFEKDLLLRPGQALQSLSESISSDTSKISLIQVSFGMVLRHPHLPLFLHLPAALERLHCGTYTTVQRCYDLIDGGYITCATPFGVKKWGEITHFWSHNPLNHLIRCVRDANVTVDTIFGRFRACKNHVKRKFAFMKDIELIHVHYLERISERLPLRLAFVANFESYQETVAALLQNSSYVTLLRRVFCTLPYMNEASESEGISTTDSRSRVVIGTFNHNWTFHMSRTGIKYLRTLQLAKASWIAHSSKDAARRMYDAEIKLRYFSYGDPRRVDYRRLKKLIGGRTVSCNADNTGILRYEVHDEDVCHPLSLSFKMDEIRLMDMVNPLPSFRKYVATYLAAAAHYDVFEVPHIVLMKAIARISYANFGPRFNDWTRLETKDFSSPHVQNKLVAVSRRKNARFTLGGHFPPVHVVTLIKSPRHLAFAIFYSASLANSEFQLSLLRQYVDNYVSYFPEMPLTRYNKFYLVGRPKQRLVWPLHPYDVPHSPSPPSEPTPKNSSDDELESSDDDAAEEPQPRSSIDVASESSDDDEEQPRYTDYEASSSNDDDADFENFIYY